MEVGAGVGGEVAEVGAEDNRHLRYTNLTKGISLFLTQLHFEKNIGQTLIIILLLSYLFVFDIFNIGRI